MSSAAIGPQDRDDEGAAPRDGAGEGRPATDRAGTGRALVLRPLKPARGRFAGLRLSHGVVAALVAVMMGTGFVAGTAFYAGKPQATAVAKADTQMDVLYRVQDEVRSLKASLDGLRTAAENGRQDDTIRGLKKSVDVLKQELEGVKAASSGAVGQLSAKIDKLDRDPGPKLAEIASRLDRLDRDPSPKLAEMTSRIDRIERQVSSPAPTASLPPETILSSKAPLPPVRVDQQAAPVVAATPPTIPKPAPVVVATATPVVPKSAPRSEAPVKADQTAKVETGRTESPVRQEAAARPATVEGWMLRDVYGGVALVEGRGGGLREVAPGEYIPGVGEIRSIERRGRSWVVVTSRGIIQADNRW
jgi:hypothetical protein